MFDIVTFGSATRDLFIKSKDFETLKDKRFSTGQGLCFNLGSKIYLDDLFFATGGGGTNTAVTFANQGLKTVYVGRVGDDPGGKAILDELDKLRIKRFVSIDKKIKTAYSIILSVLKKERTILVYNGACHYLEVGNVPFNQLKSKWFYIAGLSGKSKETLSPIINFAKKNKIKVALNPGVAQLTLGLNGLKNILATVDVLLLNQEEGAKLAGLPFKKEKEIFKKLDKYVKGIIVMTKGPKGVVVSDGKYIYSAGIFKEKRFVDRTGAGDAFGSGFVSGLIRTGKIEQAIRLGSANGTAVVEELGAKNGLLTKNKYEKGARWKKFKITKNKL
ncbi:MAG: carbohydrate kinase family protein [Patescibacteria group bacterium]